MTYLAVVYMTPVCHQCATVLVKCSPIVTALR